MISRVRKEILQLNNIKTEERKERAETSEFVKKMWGKVFRDKGMRR